MKLGKFCVYPALALTTVSLALSGCGSSNGAIATSVLVSSSLTTLILGQAATITATVTGPTDVNVVWGQPNKTAACTYTTQPNPTTSQPNPPVATALTCPSDGSLGALTNEQTTGPGTATFTAPTVLPDPNKYPNLKIIITACADANNNKCNNTTLLIDSGVGVTLTPATAAVPTGEPNQFFAIVANDSTDPTKMGVTWLLTQQSPNATSTSGTANPFGSLATCTVAGNASGCGSIDVNGVYTAPMVVPTNTTPQNTTSAPTDCTTPELVTLVAISKDDPTRYTTGSITITQGGPITFNGISPTIAPQGAAYWDVYLNAPNISSVSTITLNGGRVDPSKIKVVFPIPVTSTSTTTTTPPGCSTSTTLPTNNPSTGARIRLNASDLANTAPVTVGVSDPAQTCNNLAAGTPCTATGTGTFNIIPVRPTVTSSAPNDIIQNTVVQQNEVFPLTIDGGYFGAGGTLANASLPFLNTPFTGRTDNSGNQLSTTKQLALQFPSGSIDTALPGLYSLSVSRNQPPLPSPNNPAISELAVFPSYATSPPTAISSLALPIGSYPSAVDIDPTLGVLAVVETGSPGNSMAMPPVPAVNGAVQFYSIGNGTLTALGSPVPVGNTPAPTVLPTGLSVNRANHTVAVVNYGEQSVTILPIPGGGSTLTPTTFDISNILLGSVSPAPIPYSIGVDPDTNMGVVAFSTTSNVPGALFNLGFLVDLNPNGTTTCLNYKNSPTSHPCAFAQVTLDTGAYPQVAMAPHGHIAFVSPGGGNGNGFLRGVDVTKPSSVIGISQVQIVAGVVTVTTETPQTVNGVTQTLFPGNAGTVLISGVPLINSNNVNGAFAANTVSDTSFTYVLNNSSANGTVTISSCTAMPMQTGCPSPYNPNGTSTFPGYPANAFFSSPNLTFSGPNSADQGIAINPITNTAALADYNSTGANGAQIDIINNLDQSLGNIGFTSQCTAYVTLCSGSAPERLGTADVAWQPYTNSVVSYNPTINQVSVSDPVSERRYALVCDLTTGTTTANQCITNPSSTPLPAICQAAPINNSVSACVQLFQNQTTLAGMGAASPTKTLNLFGGLAVDPATNQAFVVMSGSNQIDIVNLGQLKPAQITELVVPPPAGSPAGAIGGIPGATVPQGTLVSASDLTGVQIFGSGFDSGTQVRFDGLSGTTLPANEVTFVNSRELIVTVPAALLSFPHQYTVDVVNSSGSQSNATDFYVVQAVALPQSLICPTVTGATSTHPSSVAIADQLRNGPFSPIAVVTNSGCNNISVVDINPADVATGKFATVLMSIPVGNTPQGVAISENFGLAVVANNAAGTVSVVDLVKGAEAVPDVMTGTSPTGIAVDNETGGVLVANTGSNTVSEIDLGLLFGSSPPTTLSPVSIAVQAPSAIAVDPDRGTNSQGLAVVTGLQLQSGLAPVGALYSIDIGNPTPAQASVNTGTTVTAPSTGIVFDPTVVNSGSTPNGAFYVSSSGGNVITFFTPEGGQSSVNVGINPTALAINPQTGAIMTTNVAGKTTSLVDTTASRLQTVQTIGLPGSAEFGIAIDQFTNLAVIVDQANDRLLILPVSR